MKKIVYTSFAVSLLLASNCLLPNFSHAQTVPAPPTPVLADNSKKVKDTVSFDLKLDFSNFNWGTNTPRTNKSEPAKNDNSKYDIQKSDTALDFSNFNWGTHTTGKSQTIKTVTIGTQIWMVQNLDVSHFRNGDAIPEAKTDNEWNTAVMEKKPVWCYYDNSPANEEKYGKLYNRYAVIDPRGLAPAGWHVPVREEWEKMMNSLPDNAETGKKMKSTAEGGYAFIQGGYRKNYSFSGIGIIGQWWSSTEKTMYGAWASSVYTGCSVFSLYIEHNRFYSSEYSKEGFSVRCIKN